MQLINTGEALKEIDKLTEGSLLSNYPDIDWKKAKKVVFSDLKPSVKTISLRLPEYMLEEIKLLANKRDIPYQSLMKIFLSERIKKELSA